MKQRVRVVGIIREGDGILLLKKNLGRAEGVAVWELPTGKMYFGEQPEEAMARTVYEYAGIKVKEVRLVDVVTFLGMEGGGQLNNLFIVYKISVQADQKIRPSERYTAYKYMKEGEGTTLRLSDASLAVLELENGRAGSEERVNFRGAANGATVFVDGASRGNPGPAGVGYHIVGENGQILKDGGEFIGFATSRVAEYYALKEGCEQAIEMGLKSVRFVSDNLMMINQMNGVFQVKNRDLMPIFEDIQKLLEKFEAVAFVHIKRAQNMDADREANRAIDRHFDEDMVE